MVSMTLVDACNGFNELICLMMLWTLGHFWPTGTRFKFNFYKHWAELLLLQPGSLPVTILSRECVIQGYPLSMFLRSITLITLVEDFRIANSGLLTHFYVDNAEFGVLVRRSIQILKLILQWSPYQGYFPEPARLIFIADSLDHEEEAKR